MREILFKGKRKDNGEWVYGDLLNVDADYDYAIRTYGGRDHGQVNAVDEKTVGQYTGLTDKNGKKIFEGDIVRLFAENGAEPIVRVGWDEWRAMFVLIDDDGEDFHIETSDFFLVLGNVHDNPELLKGAYNA